MDFAHIIKSTYPKCHTRQDYRNIRQMLKEYGINNFKQEMTNRGIFMDGKITSELVPFNPFARIISGKTENPCKDLCPNKNYIILQNKPINDEHWQDSSPEWLGIGSMSKKHKFLAIMSDRWSTFNILSCGLDQFGLEECIKMLDEMEKIALEYTIQNNWSNNIGLYFHCYPFNSVQSIHLHIVDCDTMGPSFEHNNYKNLSISDAKFVLMKEIENKKLN